MLLVYGSQYSQRFEPLGKFDPSLIAAEVRARLHAFDYGKIINSGLVYLRGVLLYEIRLLF